MQGEQAPQRDLEGETVVITAGPTQEPLDPVRFISNRSSGKMGYALAEAAVAAGRARGADLRTGALCPLRREQKWCRVETAMEMRTAVLEHLDAATIIIKAAAVADYHLAQRSDAKDEEDGGPAHAGSGSDDRYPG